MNRPIMDINNRCERANNKHGTHYHGWRHNILVQHNISKTEQKNFQ